MTKKDPGILHEVIEFNGWNALFLIINNCQGSDETKLCKINLLLDSNVDVNIRDKINAKTAMHYAVETKNEQLISAIYHYDQASTMTLDNFGKSPVDYVERGGIIEAFFDLYSITQFTV